MCVLYFQIDVPARPLQINLSADISKVTLTSCILLSDINVPLRPLSFQLSNYVVYIMYVQL